MYANFRVVTYCDDNHLLPIFEKGQQEYTVEQLVSFLIGDATSEKVWKSQPMAVKHSSSFLINLNCIIQFVDL